MRRLGVAHAFLYALDFIFNVAVGDQNIGPAVIVIIKKEAAEAKRDQRGTAHFRARGFVDEKAVAFVVIEREHLVGKICDDDAGLPGTIVVGGVDTHSSASDTVFAKGNARGHSALFEGAIFFVQVKLVGLRVIGEKNVRPAIAVVVENRDSQSF